VMNQLRLFHLRTNEVISYYDDMSLTRTDKEYVKEVLQNEVTFDNGKIICSPAISVSTGSGSIAKGETEGGNDRTYFTLRDDVEGKVGDYVLEVYQKANQKNSGIGGSSVGIGVTDGSSEGDIYVFDFDMMVNVIEKYDKRINFFARIRAAHSGNAGLYQQLTVVGDDVILDNKSGDRTLGTATIGTVGEWFHVKMIFEVINPSNINNTDPTAHTVRFYLITYDADGNEVLATYSSCYTSFVATNKYMSTIFFTGADNAYDFDQQYFLDNITYVRTTDTSVIPEIPAEPAE
ncbi:MAG: hypothetical protein IJW66_05550, partial [Clostridia bacterium]|nr:hypothetical protein [Clostridia bacterium]